MKDSLHFRQQFPASKGEVFKFFTQPNLLEKWATPKGMTLKIPLLDPKTGGQYRYEHRTADGMYVCTGVFKEFIPEQKLVHLDHVINPDGKVIYDQLESTVTFMDNPGGTIVNINVSGFQDQGSMDGCEQGWNESLQNLVELFDHIRARPGQELRSHQARGY